MPPFQMAQFMRQKAGQCARAHAGRIAYVELDKTFSTTRQEAVRQNELQTNLLWKEHWKRSGYQLLQKVSNFVLLLLRNERFLSRFGPAVFLAPVHERGG